MSLLPFKAAMHLSASTIYELVLSLEFAPVHCTSFTEDELILPCPQHSPIQAQQPFDIFPSIDTDTLGKSRGSPSTSCVLATRVCTSTTHT